MKIFCIIGDERAFRTKSPAMFTAVFKRIGITASYVPLKVFPDQIGEAMQSLRTLNFDGANITIPHKSSVIPYMNILSEGANIIGAVNTIIRNGNELKGYNTNAIGFMDTLEEQGFDVTNKKALIFGSGGGARAVVFILNWLRSESIEISGRTARRVENIVNKIGGKATTLDSIAQTPSSANIVINTTPVSSPDDSPEFTRFLQEQKFKDCELILDLNYGRKNNIWEKKAKELKVPFIDGLRPLAHAARRTMLLWTRVDVEPSEFLKAIE
ncbi:shikimate dehydrogenase family protein [Desulfamplus magnetovallimortis]|nr:hypothetical protein [Desulfamplus magnetovallimortis]